MRSAAFSLYCSDASGANCPLSPSFRLVHDKGSYHALPDGGRFSSSAYCEQASRLRIISRCRFGDLSGASGWTIRPLVENFVPAGIEHLCSLRHQNDIQHLDGLSSVLLTPQMRNVGVSCALKAADVSCVVVKRRKRLRPMKPKRLSDLSKLHRSFCPTPIRNTSILPKRVTPTALSELTGTAAAMSI